MSHPNLFPTTYPNATKSILFRYFGFEIKWWSEVYELTQTFYHNVTQHMTLTDKQLRRTATELYRLSQRRFGVTGT